MYNKYRFKIVALSLLAFLMLFGLSTQVLAGGPENPPPGKALIKDIKLVGVVNIVLDLTTIPPTATGKFVGLCVKESDPDCDECKTKCPQPEINFSFLSDAANFVALEAEDLKEFFWEDQTGCFGASGTDKDKLWIRQVTNFNKIIIGTPNITAGAIAAEVVVRAEKPGI